MRTSGFLLAASAGCLAAAVAAVNGTPWRTDPAGLEIHPSVVRLDDRLYKEGDQLRVPFRVINRSGDPYTIKEYATSCTCSASETGDGPSPPFTLGPGESAQFFVTTTIMATSDAVRTFEAMVVSERKGEPQPGLVASLEVPIEDMLLPYPNRIDVVDAPADRPLRRNVVLATRRGETAVPTPVVEVEGGAPDWLKVVLAPTNVSDLDKEGFRAHYRLDMDFDPSGSERDRSGVVLVRIEGRSPMRIPVYYGVKAPYRLSAQSFTLRGRPGETASSKLFYEFSDPAWGSPALSEIPEGVEAGLETFNATTHVIRIQTRIPDPDAERAPLRPLVLRFGRDDRKIELPIHIEGGAR